MCEGLAHGGSARERDPKVGDACRTRTPSTARRRAAEIDRSYEAYDAIPLDTEDEWGNLAGFLDAAACRAKIPTPLL